jgi:hypothetical protein
MTSIAALALSVLATMSPLSSADTPIKGDWHGESICQQKNTACRDEQIVLHFSAPDATGKLSVAADKIVSGKAVDMGTVWLQYDREKHVLDGNDEGRIWHFQVRGAAMTGTLTTGGQLIRKISVTKN